MVASMCNPTAGQAKTSASLGLTTSQPNLLGASERLCLREEEKEGEEEEGGGGEEGEKKEKSRKGKVSLPPSLSLSLPPSLPLLPLYHHTVSIKHSIIKWPQEL